MSFQTSHMDRIRHSLGVLVSEIQLSKTRRTSVFSAVEEVCRGLLNLVYDYELVSMDQLSQNCSGVDLADPAHGIAVQVTSSNTASKVARTVEQFRSGASGQRGCDQYRTLLVLILDNAPRTKGIEKLSVQDFDLQVMNMPDLLGQIEHLPIARMKQIADYLDDVLGTARADTASAAAPEHRLPAPPHPAAAFVEGIRERELREMDRLLQQRHSLFLYGPAGVGKTQLALKYAAKYAPRRGVYFLRYRLPPDPEGEAMRETILRAEFSGYQFTGRDTRRHDEEYRQRLRLLQEEYRGALLIIDGFDWPGKTLEDLRAEESFRDLARSGPALLFTTRFPVEQPAMEVGPLSEADSMKLMKHLGADQHYPDQALKAAGAMMNHYPLFVDQLARLMKRMHTYLPVDKLQSMLSGGTTETKTAAAIQFLLRPHLQALSGPKCSILRAATLLPEEGLDLPLFRNALPGTQHQALYELMDEGWLGQKEGLVTVLPILRELYRQELKPTAQNCGSFLKRLWYYPQELYWRRQPLLRQKEVARRLALTFAMAAENLADSGGIFAQRCGEIWKSIHETAEALRWELQAIRACETTSKQKSWKLAGVYHLAGECHQSLGEQGSALACWEKTLELCTSGLRISDPDLAAVHGRVGKAHLELGHYEQARLHLREALALREDWMPDDHPARKSTYEDLAAACGKLGLHQEALEYRLKALHENGAAYWGGWGKDLEEKLQRLAQAEAASPGDQTALADASADVGRAYGALGDYANALEYQIKALSIRERALPPGHPDLARSYQAVGDLYRDLGEHGVALEYLRRALKIREADDPEIAGTYRDIGGIYADMGDPVKALEFQIKALGILESAQPVRYRELANVYQDMSAIYDALGDFFTARNYQKHALGIWEQILPPGHPELAAAYDRFASILVKTEERRGALEYWRKAQDICEKTYPAGHPLRASLRNSIAWVQEQMDPQ